MKAEGRMEMTPDPIPPALDNEPADVDFGLPEHLSFWCKVNLVNSIPHHECSGTCDSGHGTGAWCGKPCQCPAH